MDHSLKNTIIHINGWPGIGKLTIGRTLAGALGARLIDNHTLINPAEMLFSRRDPLYASLRADIRRVVLDHLARADPALSVVFTDALSDDDFDTRRFGEFVELAHRRNARLIAIVLDCAEEENERRLLWAGRAERRKLTNADVLRELRAKLRLLRGPADRLIELDVTALSADKAATTLVQKMAEDAKCDLG